MAKHILPPAKNAGNIPVWPDTITGGNTISVKKIHIDNSTGGSNGLRDYLNGELTRRFLPSVSYTNQPIVVHSTTIKAQHITELRSYMDNCRTGVGNGGDGTYPCEIDSYGATGNWPSGVVASGTSIQATHFNELRTKVQYLMTACVCETEQCQFCTDCGYGIWTCSDNGISCNDHGGNGCGHHYWNHSSYCGSMNVGGSHPYRQYSGGGSMVWDGWVDYAWQPGVTPPGSNWSGAPWTCKCSPYTW